MDMKAIVLLFCWLFFLSQGHKAVVNGSIAETWKELSGETKWKGLLGPLSVDLRRYLIHYGERVQAIADAFNTVTRSTSFGFTRFPKKDFFAEAYLQTGNPYKYRVYHFFYTRSDLKIRGKDWKADNSWVGYVAHTTDEGSQVLGRRDILICWRGSIIGVDWVVDLDVSPVSASDIYGKANDPKVHSSFLTIYTQNNHSSDYTNSSARKQVLTSVRELVDQFSDEEVSITVTGHGIGAALATLNAVDIAYNGYNKPTNKSRTVFPVTSFLFAGPPVGDNGFKRVVEGLRNDLHILRVRNVNDKAPPMALGYVDVGERADIDTSKSSDLKAEADPHELEVYLHGIALEGSKLVVNRSPALVNKWIDGLRDESEVPAKWWVDKFKSMVQIDDGNWILEAEYYTPHSASV